MTSITKTTRIAFFANDKKNGPAFQEEAFIFDWYMGMSWVVRQRSSIALHEVVQQKYPDRHILEVSTKSVDFELGRQLSAFVLTIGGVPVENCFQAAKKFNDGGPYLDLLKVSPKQAKRDDRLKINKQHPSRKLLGFWSGKAQKYIGLEPKSLFYDWLYIRALNQNKDLARKVMQYDTFTDIEFNQKIPYADKQGPFNCQARSVAIYVWLKKNKKLQAYLDNPEGLIKTIYPPDSPKQKKLFDQ